jgi:hypothetical protein
MTGGGKNSVEQLDFLRGIAICMMIVNHVGERLLDNNLLASGLLADLVFVGSFAPVVFFFTTGFGIGFAKRDVTPSSFLSTLLKAGLLVVADQLMLWRTATLWGVDFLGFIAISSVLVTSLAASKKSIWLCTALMLGVFAIRFGLGGWARERPDLPGILIWLIGARGIDGISYPFSPWIIYPLLGFLLGRGYGALQTSHTSFPRPWLYLATVAALISAAALDRANAIFFRWGTMSFAFFVLSIGVLFLTLIVAWRVTTRLPRVSQLLSLRGISSLAIVPIHYALIEIIAETNGSPLGAIAAATAMIVAVILSVILSRAFAACVETWISSVSPVLASVPLACLVALCAGICWWYPIDKPTVRLVAFVTGQLAITALLVVRNRKTSPSLITKPALS